MTIENVELPYPEIEREQQESKSIKEQYADLVAREAKEAEAALNIRLDGINSSGDISELKSSMALRIKFVERFGPNRFGDLNRSLLQRQNQTRLAAELAEKQSRQGVSTVEGRLKALNAKRKASN
jgi:hypothetical protein